MDEHLRSQTLFIDNDELVFTCMYRELALELALYKLYDDKATGTCRYFSNMTALITIQMGKLTSCVEVSFGNLRQFPPFRIPSKRRYLKPAK